MKKQVNYGKCNPPCNGELCKSASWVEECPTPQEVEYIISCRKCGRVHTHWSYGVFFIKT